jgi:hypothetical protein
MSAAHDLHDFERDQLDSQWLFRQGDLVLGPISGHQLVEKLYTGELTGDTEVSDSGPSDFRQLKDVDAFQLHVAKVVVKAKVEAEARLERARRARGRLIAGGVITVMLGVLGLGAWQASRYVAVMSFEDELLIQVEPPIITVARPSVPEELLEYPGEPKRTPPPERVVSRPAEKSPEKPAETPEEQVDTPRKPEALAMATPSPKSTSRRTASSSSSASSSSAGGRSKSSADPDGLQMMTQFDMASINQVVKKHQPSLFRCFKEEAQRQPGLSTKVPLEFTIGNDGRVAKLWVDHPQLKKGPLHDCLFEELRKWPFKPYEGERATVNLAFNIGKK